MHSFRDAFGRQRKISIAGDSVLGPLSLRQVTVTPASPTPVSWFVRCVLFLVTLTVKSVGVIQVFREASGLGFRLSTASVSRTSGFDAPPPFLFCQLPRVQYSNPKPGLGPRQ